jgi:hypothetical protein
MRSYFLKHIEGESFEKIMLQFSKRIIKAPMKQIILKEKKHSTPMLRNKNTLYQRTLEGDL